MYVDVLAPGTLPCVQQYMTDATSIRMLNTFRAEYASYRLGDPKGAKGEMIEVVQAAACATRLHAFWEEQDDASEKEYSSGPLVAHKQQRPVVLVIGSSVALGSGATSAEAGWAGLLGAALKERGVELRNAAVSGVETAYTLGRMQAVVPATVRPHVVVSSLSLGNEGLCTVGPEDISAMRFIGDRFVMGTRKIAEHAAKHGAGVVLGSAYAHANYTATHAAEIRRVNEHLERIAADLDDAFVVDFHSATSDGVEGAKWAEGLEYNKGHPNDAGHARMFESIDVDALAALAFKRSLTRDIDGTTAQTDFIPPSPKSWGSSH